MVSSNRERKSIVAMSAGRRKSCRRQDCAEASQGEAGAPGRILSDGVTLAERLRGSTLARGKRPVITRSRSRHRGGLSHRHRAVGSISGKRQKARPECGRVGEYRGQTHDMGSGTYWIDRANSRRRRHCLCGRVATVPRVLGNVASQYHSRAIVIPRSNC